ncbi:ABC transporter permease [Nitrospira sp. BLG_1]|uniref:ABC transporter permease n=1 Tax=Nitrospira sp. BLG_1 TaxID=3395883 RepID=UPI0039BC6044
MASVSRAVMKDRHGPDSISADALRIVPLETLPSLGIREIWIYRELLYFLAWRDLKVRYHQTILGILWAVIKPCSMMIVFSVFFGWLGRIPSDGLPYPIFVFAALLPWQLFAHTLSATSHSLVANQHLITKVYFPRLIIPISSMGIGLIDFGIALLVLFVMLLYYHIPIIPQILALPAFMMLGITSALGVGLWASALNIRHRDVGHAIPFVTQLWFFVTPVAYPSSLIPESWRAWYGINPMASVVEGFRWALFGNGVDIALMFILSLLISSTLLISGLYFFRRTEQTFADVA